MESQLYSQIDIFNIVILSIMGACLIRSDLYDHKAQRPFFASICLTIFSNIFDILFKLSLDGVINSPAWLTTIFSNGHFLTFAGAAYCWLLYTLISCNSKFYKNKIALALSIVPLIVLLALDIANAFTGCLFWFDIDTGEFERGILFILQHIFAVIYVLFASVECIIFARRQKNFARKKIVYKLSLFFLPFVACVILQTIFQHLPIMICAPTISFVLIYVSSLRTQIALDPLTNIGNKRQLLMDLNDCIKKVPDDKKLYFFFMDIDAFKNTNDVYGHYEADRALKAVASGLNEFCLDSVGACARFGGDEFAVIEMLDESRAVESVCDDIRSYVDEQCKKDRISCPVHLSIGYAEYDKDADTVESLISRADQHMYVQKTLGKQNIYKS